MSGVKVLTVAGLYFMVSAVRSQLCLDGLCSWWETQCWRRRKSGDSSAERKVREIFQETRLRRYKWVLTRAAVLGSLPLATVIALLVWSSWEDQAILLEYMLKTALMDVVVGVLLSILVHFWSSLLSVLTTDIFFGLLFVAIGSHSAFCITTYAFVSATRGVQILQLCLASVIGERKRISAALLVNTAIQIAIILSIRELQSLENALNIVEFNTLAFSIAYLTESVGMEEARAMVGQIDATRGEAIALNLLQVMCDAVVHLKSDHSLREPCARLDALLLRRTSPWKPGEAGPLFTKYLPAQDVPRFQSFLESAQPGEAGSLNVSLLDSLGNMVSSQLFHTCVQSVDGELEHLVGITEENDDGARQQEGILNPNVVNAETLGKLHDFETEEGMQHTRSERSHQSGASSRSRSSSKEHPLVSLSSWGAGAEGEDWEVFYQIGAKLEARVVAESPDARTLFNLGSDVKLSDFVKNFRDGGKIRVWLKSVYQSSVFGGSPPRMTDLGQVGVICHAGVYEAKLIATCSRSHRRDVSDAGHFDISIEFSLKPLAAPLHRLTRRSRNSYRAARNMLRPSDGVTGLSSLGTPPSSSRRSLPGVSIGL